MSPNANGAQLTGIRQRVLSARADIGAVAISVLVLAIAFLPILAGGRTFSASTIGLGTKQVDTFRLDTAASSWAFEPWAEVTSRSYALGELPLWNPYQAAGAPHAANMQSGAFDPLLAVVNRHPTPLTWDLTIFAVFAIGAVSTYVLLRVLGAGYLGSIAGATAYSLSGVFIQDSNNHFIFTYVYLPIMALAVEWLTRSTRLTTIFAVAVVMAASIAVGMPESALFVVTLVSAWGVWRSFVGPRSSTSVATLLRLGAGLGLGTAMAAPLLLPFAEYERISFNVHTGSTTGTGADPARLLLHWIFPYVNGDPTGVTTSPALSGTKGWVGAAAVALALIGVASRDRRARVAVPFFGVAAVVGLAKIYGLALVNWVGTPVYRLANFNRFSEPVVAFSVATLVGFGAVVIEPQPRALRESPLRGVLAGTPLAREPRLPWPAWTPGTKSVSSSPRDERRSRRRRPDFPPTVGTGG